MMHVPCEDYPWFPEELPPMRYRFCENYEVLTKRLGVEFPRTSDRVVRTWHLLLRFRTEQLILKVYEELASLTAPNCEQCRCNGTPASHSGIDPDALLGWQHHPVSSKKLHFILPSPLAMDLPVEQLFDSKLHILHGVVHSNGYGHLLRINGLEGGSQFLRGKQVMHLWDQLCQRLRVRDVSVEDVSSKKGMLLRVLFPIVNKTTFYMRHGYQFGRGQFHVNELQWNEAVENLHSTSLLDLMIDFKGIDERVQKIILRYGLTAEGELGTIGMMLERMCLLAEDEQHALRFGLKQLSGYDSLNERSLAVLKRIEEEMETRMTNGVVENEVLSDEEDLHHPLSEEHVAPLGDIEDGRVNATTPVKHDVSDVSFHRPGSDHEIEPHCSINDITFDEEVTTRTSRKSKKRTPLDDPRDLIKPRICPFNAASLFEGSRKYSATKMVEIIRITLGVLQKYENRWVRLQELRDILYETAHDRVLADFVLGRMANTIVNGYSIIKQRSKTARCNYYLFEKYHGGEGEEAVQETFLGQIEEPAGIAPGPEVVNGQSLERFERYLALLFKWMCLQPHVSIGRGPNKNKPKPKRKEPEIERVGIPVGNVRVTRAAVSNASKRSRLDCPRPITKPWLEKYPSEITPHLEVLRVNGPEPGSPLYYRKNVLVDLMYFYQSALEVYKPLIDRKKSVLRLPEFSRQVQVLKDAKFFLRRFQPDPPTPLAIEKNGTPGLLRIVCQVHLEPTVPSGLENSRLKNAQPEFFRQSPPPEEVYVPAGSSMLEVKIAVEEAFGQIYTMFEMWSILEMSNFKLGTVGTAVLNAPPESIIDVRGRSFRRDLELRHSGGIEDWEVLCSCGTRDDDGARMLCCDSCSVWMHTRCAGFRDDVNVPSFFQCAHCRQY